MNAIGALNEAMIQKAKNGEEIRVVDDIYMSPTHTKDVAEVLGEFLELRPELGFIGRIEGKNRWLGLPWVCYIPCS